MNIFKKALIVALSVGLVSVPSVTREVDAASAIDEGVILYFDSPSWWDADGASTSAYLFGNGDKWVDMTKLSDGTWKLTMPTGGYTNFIFVRTNPSVKVANGLSWDNGNWGAQTADLSYDGSHNYYKNTNSNSYWGTVPNDYFTWTDYYEFKLTLNYNDGVTADTEIELKAGEQSTSLPTPTRDGYLFKGWASSADATSGDTDGTYDEVVTKDDTLYAIWEEASKPTYSVTVTVGSFSETVSVEEGTSASDVINGLSTKIANNKLVVKEWDFDGEITSATEINATKYYTTFDHVKYELGFSYNLTSTLVVFQLYVDYGVEPNVIGVNSETSEESDPIAMSWEEDKADDKKEFSAYVPTKYNKLKFQWGTDGELVVNRDYYKNAIWYNNGNGDNMGTWHYDGATATNGRESDFAINSVSDMKLRVGTLAMLASGFGGVDTYGIRIAKGSEIANDNYYGPSWSAAEVTKVDANGNAKADGEYIRWNAVVNNIPEEYYTGDFTATAYVVIDGVSYDICTDGPRTVSVVDLADTYTSELSGSNKYACQYIVDTYSVA